MFDRKGKKKQRLAISVKALTVKDIEKAAERIDSEFPDEGAEDALIAVAHVCVQAGARIMANEIIHGERSAEEYAAMRRDVSDIAEMTVLAHALEAKGKKVTLEDILKEVLG